MKRRRCARCGEDWVPGYDRCWNCGFDQSVPVPDASFSAGPGVCTNCQTGLNPGDRFCPECGAPVPTQLEPVPFTPQFRPDEPAPRGRRFGFREIGLVLVALAVLIASVYSVRPTPNRNHTVVGALTLFQTELEMLDSECVGSGEFGDLAPGGRVIVRNEDGDTIGIGRLERSDWLGSEACRFWFVVPDVPRADVYAFEIAERDRVEYTRKQLEDANWRVFLIAGDPPRI